MLGLDDSLVQGCTATVACHGNEHRLVVRDHALVAVDHQSEAAKVLDALTDEVPCRQLAAAWVRTRWRYAHLDPDPFLMWLGNLIPADIAPAEHEAFVQTEVGTYGRFTAILTGRQRTLDPASPQQAALAELQMNAAASERVRHLPNRLRLYLGLLCCAEAAKSGVPDPAHARELGSAVTACVDSWTALGYPSAATRVRLLEALRVPGRRSGNRRTGSTITPF